MYTAIYQLITKIQGLSASSSQSFPTCLFNTSYSSQIHIFYMIFITHIPHWVTVLCQYWYKNYLEKAWTYREVISGGGGGKKKKKTRNLAKPIADTVLCILYFSSLKNKRFWRTAANDHRNFLFTDADPNSCLWPNPINITAWEVGGGSSGRKMAGRS